MAITLSDTLPPETVRRRWTVPEFERAIGLGLFAQEERVELHRGEIVVNMSPKNAPHNNALALAAEALREAFGPGRHLRIEQPLRLSPDTRREPDLFVLPGRIRDYPETPTADRTLLVLEVSDTTLETDRTVKRRLYAEAGVPEYWVLNLQEGCLHVWRSPAPTIEGADYSIELRREADETVSPQAAPDAAIPVDELLP